MKIQIGTISTDIVIELLAADIQLIMQFGSITVVWSCIGDL